MTESSTSTEPTPTYRFIPFRKTDIVEMCLRDGDIADEAGFRKLAIMLSSVFHFEFHKLVETLKDSYAPIDPDADTRSIDHGAPQPPREFRELLEGLLEKANYESISEEDLNKAMHEASMFKIRLHVDFGDFEEVSLFCRGVSQRDETLTSLFGLIKKPISFTNYDRVVLYIRFRDDYDAEDAPFKVCRPGATVLKMFQNVPKADLEMLFPNTAVRMRLIDKLFIGVPAVVSGGIVFSTKLGASFILLGSLFGFWLGLSAEPVELDKTAMMVLFAGIAALGGYLWKQFSNFKNRKIRFMQTLTQNLYFKNLDNNAGVFHRLANDAEEEECKEALLAYAFLLGSEDAMTQSELDRAIERWLDERWQCTVDFEIDDALNKLESLQLVAREGERLSVIPIDEALKTLDKRWDEYFVC